MPASGVMNGGWTALAWKTLSSAARMTLLNASRSVGQVPSTLGRPPGVKAPLRGAYQANREDKS